MIDRGNGLDQFTLEVAAKLDALSFIKRRLKRLDGGTQMQADSFGFTIKGVGTHLQATHAVTNENMAKPPQV